MINKSMLIKANIIVLFLLMFGVPVYGAGKVLVFVSIVPQKYFVGQIGKDLVDIKVMVQPGASPATYEPKPSQMAALSKTKLYFSIGVPFENTWLKKIAASNQKMKIIHTDHGIKKILMQVNIRDNNKEHGHDHEVLDPHIWLSPELVMIQAETIKNALKKIDPAHDQVYEANFKAFIAKLIELDIELKNIFVGKDGLQFIVFHPSWGYFANSYGLKQIPIEIQGKRPKPAQLKYIIEHAKKNNIKIIFVQPQFSSKSARLIAKQIKGQIVFANPLAENWMTNMREMADKFAAISINSH